MAEDVKDTVRKIRKTVGGIVRSSPVMTITEGIADVGEYIIKHTPKGVRKVGRQLRREVHEALQSVPGITRRIKRGVRKATSRKTTRKTTRKSSRGRRTNASRR